MLAEEAGVPLLGQIPLVAEVGEMAEKGMTIFNQSDPIVVKQFENFAKKLVEEVI